MARKGGIKKRVRQLGLIRRLWRNFKILVLLGIIALIGYGIWYSKQDEATQVLAQERTILVLDWLIDLDATNRDADEMLHWVIRLLPASLGKVVSVGDIEGADQYTLAGIPVGATPVKILQNAGYIVGYDETMRNPAWVAYHLKGGHSIPSSERPDTFEVDKRTRARVDHFDYSNSGFDRGHLAPNYAINRVFGSKAQRETFLMSNIVPQKPALNQGPWKDLEHVVANRYLKNYEEIWVITGPIYEAPLQRLSSGVAIPVAFFKIIIDVVDPGGIRAIALVLEQDMNPDDPLSSSIVSIDAVERLSGFDFLGLLDDAAESALEENVPKRLW